MVRIIADSTCDLPGELLKQYQIEIIPLHVVLGEEEYKDGESITPDEIYAWSDANKQQPKTSAVSMEDAENAFGKALEAGDEVIAFAISGTMSTTVNVMRLAAQSLEAEDRITIIDTMNLSTGGGLLVVEAAEMAAQGMNRTQIEERILALRSRVRASFVVDTLTFLHRGGRCSGVAALAGGALRLHPRISVCEGKMAPGKKYRGAMNKVVLTYAQDMEEDLKKAAKERVFITHSGCSQEEIGAVKAYLESLDRFEEIHITRAGSVISSHCGPGTLGVLFIAGE